MIFNKRIPVIADSTLRMFPSTADDNTCWNVRMYRSEFCLCHIMMMMFPVQAVFEAWLNSRNIG